MIRSFIRYLFPKVRNADKLPLLPLTYWTDKTVKITPEEEEEIRLLKGSTAARTDIEAKRLLARHQGQDIGQTIKQYKRRRKRHPRIERAINRFKRLWE